MQLKNIQTKLQKFGAVLSAMVMPNIGIFIGWGIMAALFIPDGWLPNKTLNELIAPILKYLLPALIGYTAGSNIYGRRGGVIGAFATFGVVIGSEVTMLIGGMVMGPVAAILLKKFDELVKGKIKPGLEMLIDNFSLGIIGFLLVIIGYLGVAPLITGLQNIVGIGVKYLTNHDLIPLVSLFVQPGDVLFLNNAINHGIMIPLGLQQAAESGKSLLFLVEANGSVWVGAALAFAVFGTGTAKKTAPGATVIMFLGGIAEVVFPYILMMPLTILGPIAGNAFSLLVLSIFNGGTVGPVSPGSVFAYFMMTPKDSVLVNTIAYFGALLISFFVSGMILRFTRQTVKDKDSQQTTEEVTANSSEKLSEINKIIFACDAGMGSSAMGASILKETLNKNGLSPEINHISVKDLNKEKDVDLIIVNSSLAKRARMMTDDKVPILTLDNFMDKSEYQKIVAKISDQTNGQLDVKENSKEEISTEHSIFPAENILLNASFQNKEEAISRTADLLIEGGYVKPKYKEEMFARDRDLTVYLGNGIALPHGLTKSKSILKSGICFIQVPEGVDFDNNTVYLIIGVAGKGDEHIKILGQIGNVLTEEENIEELVNAENKATVRQILDIQE